MYCVSLLFGSVFMAKKKNGDSSRQLPTVNRLFPSAVGCVSHAFVPDALSNSQGVSALISWPNSDSLLLNRFHCANTSTDLRKARSRRSFTCCLIKKAEVQYLSDIHFLCFVFCFLIIQRRLRQWTSAVPATATRPWMSLQLPTCFHPITRKLNTSLFSDHFAIWWLSIASGPIHHSEILFFFFLFVILFR